MIALMVALGGTSYAAFALPTREGNSSITAAAPAITLLGPSDNRGGVAFQYAQPDGHVVRVNAYVDDHNTIGDFDGCSASGSGDRQLGRAGDLHPARLNITCERGFDSET